MCIKKVAFTVRQSRPNRNFESLHEGSSDDDKTSLDGYASEVFGIDRNCWRENLR